MDKGYVTRIFVRFRHRFQPIDPITFPSIKGTPHVKPPTELPKKARGNLVRTPSIRMSALRLG